MNAGRSQAICRAWGWLSISLFIAVCLAAMCSLPSDRPRPVEDLRTVNGIMTGLLSLCALAAIWAWRAQVAADERCLRWRRGLGGWQSAYWDEVTDFYLTIGRKKSETSRVIEIGATKIRIDGMWNCPQAFQDIVAERACRARARSWHPKGTRTEDDWPRTFSYDTADNRWTPVIMGVCLAFLIGLPIAISLPKLIHTYGTAEWGWNLASASLFLLLMSAYSFMAIIGLAGSRDTRRRHRQRITADLEKITFEDGANRVEAAWSEVTAIYGLPRRGLFSVRPTVVETRNGLFDFTGHLGSVRDLRRIFAQNAARAVEAGQREHPDDEDLLQGQGLTPGGEQAFHFRNRTTRALLWVPTAMAFVGPFLHWLELQGLTLRPPNSDWVWVTLVTAPPTLYLWWRFYTARVTLDTLGITQKLPFSAKKILWSDIREYKMSGDDIMQFLNIFGSWQRIRIWFGITNAARLKQEIANRAIQSRNQGWNESDKDQP